MNPFRSPRAVLPAALLLAAAAPPAPPAKPYGYVELADMALAAPLVVAATITRSAALAPEQAPGLAPGHSRYLVDAAVDALVAGRADLPATVRYLVDVPDPPGRKPGRLKLKDQPVLLLAAPGSRPGELRLIGPRAQLPRTPELEERLRAILTARVAPDAPPEVAGLGHAFHVAGSLPGEGETQIFVRTADGRPISLNVLRRPGEQPRWSVSLSELVDQSAAPPARDTLLWYRLACGLPRALPQGATEGQSPEDAAQAREDYGVVLAGLGPCERAKPE